MSALVSSTGNVTGFVAKAKAFPLAFISILTAWTLSIWEAIASPFLRYAYFMGPVWGGMEPFEICHAITSVEASFWEETGDRREACFQLLEKKFQAWDATVLFYLWAFLIVCLILNFSCFVCCIRPYLKSRAK